MERTILFRGKRIDNGEWVEGYYFQIPQLKLYEIYTGKIDIVEDIKRESYAVNPKSVGQYIGFTTEDKTTKIYDKDIIQFDITENGETFETVKGEVEWLQEDCRWIVRLVDDEGQWYYPIEGDTYFKCSILGNMIDNCGILEN